MSILVIDDEAGLRRSVRAFLEDADYTVLEAANGLEGFNVLKDNINVLTAVIVDLNMPEMDGYSFIRHATAETSELPIIVLSGVGIVEDALQAMRLGAWDFITKPLHNLNILEYTLNKVWDKARLIKENRQYQENLEQLVQERTAEVESTRRQIMQRLSRAAEYKDNETGHHVIRVGEISALLAQALNLDEKRCEMIRECAPLHDIGKIGIPDNILLKPGQLAPDEWEIMRKHCIYGCEILGPLSSKDDAHKVCSDPNNLKKIRDNELLHLAQVLALCHHENWDGSGYPFGLSGEDIPLEARIVAVVDVYDALGSDRAYKKAFPQEKCFEIIKEESGKKFDPHVVKAFQQRFENIIKIREKWKG